MKKLLGIGALLLLIVGCSSSEVDEVQDGGEVVAEATTSSNDRDAAIALMEERREAAKEVAVQTREEVVDPGDEIVGENYEAVEEEKRDLTPEEEYMETLAKARRDVDEMIWISNSVLEEEKELGKLDDHANKVLGGKDE